MITRVLQRGLLYLNYFRMIKPKKICCFRYFFIVVFNSRIENEFIIEILWHIFSKGSATRLERFEKFTKRGASRVNNYEIMLQNSVNKCLSSNNIKNKSVISFPVIEIYVFQIMFLFYFSKNFLRL